MELKRNGVVKDKGRLFKSLVKAQNY